jgi:salicylate hydroxylase
MKNKITIGIIGGGIAGLVFANFLKDNNKFKIKIFEKKKYFTDRPVTGIQISNNARRILNKINFNQLDTKQFSEVHKVNIFQYEDARKIAELNINQFNSDKEEYISLDRNCLINFLLSELKKKIEVCHEEVVSIQNNTIHYAKKLEEKFDIIIVADGIFSRFENKKWESSLKKISALAYRGVIRGYDSGRTANVDLFLGNNKHFVFYPINKSGDFSFTSIFASNSSSLSNDYSSASSSEELLNISNNANDEIKKIISSASYVYKWPIYHRPTINFGQDQVFIIGDASHAMPPFHAQGAAQAIEDSFCLAQMFKKNTLDISHFKSIRTSRVEMISSKSYRNLFIYHLSNPFFKIVRNILIKIICKYPMISKFYFGKIYNYKFKN